MDYNQDALGVYNLTYLAFEYPLKTYMTCCLVDKINHQNIFFFFKSNIS